MIIAERIELNLAVLAVEVKLAERQAALDEMAVMCHFNSIIAAGARAELEQIAARIGLSPDATKMLLDDWETRAKLLRDAAEFLRALIPLEKKIKELLKSHAN